jgi:beta-phosphoglucomutase
MRRICRNDELLRPFGITIMLIYDEDVMTEEKRAVLWDMDGTLLHTTEQHRLAWRDTMAAEGFELTEERFAESFGRRDVDALRGYLGPNLAAGEIERICAGKDTRYLEMIRTAGVTLLPGVEQWLMRLKSQGWHQAIASSATRRVIKTVLAALNITSYFDLIISAEDIERGKPDPQIFLIAASKLGVQPSRCVIVEDAPAGIEAARQAGMYSIGVLTTHSILPMADLVVITLDCLAPHAFNRLLSAGNK